jgi:hypothetical protein
MSLVQVWMAQRGVCSCGLDVEVYVLDAAYLDLDGQSAGGVVSGCGGFSVVVTVIGAAVSLPLLWLRQVDVKASVVPEVVLCVSDCPVVHFCRNASFLVLTLLALVAI